jgi:hypothetical protein
MVQCCAGQRNTCGITICIDRTASSDYLYRLSPGEPERYEPTGHDTEYQRIDPTRWPEFGTQAASNGDLRIGASNGPPGPDGLCSQGYTYRGSNNEACGGDGNWRHTDLEVWVPL